MNKWRDAQLPVRFFMMDARAIAAILIFIFNMSWMTFAMMIVVLVTLYILERNELTIPAALRRLRSKIAGKRRHNLINQHRSGKIDYDKF